MSGINEIKKKAKLSIDEMYDNQTVGNLDVHEEIKTEKKQSGQTEVQPDDQTTNKEANHFSDKLENHVNHKQDLQSNRHSSLFLSSKQLAQKAHTYKMTFNLTEEMYKAFNDLYANRMLQGRKTEKSEMICEAIQWLIKMEKK